MERLYAIRYDSRSTVNGEPVGRVYVVDIGHVSPGSYSYSKELREATLWPEDEAEQLVRNRWWHGATLVPTTASAGTPA